MIQEEKVLFKATVVIPIRDGQVLLAIKTRKIGAGCWNGYGGGVEEGETTLECATRELKDESGLIASKEDLEKVAIADFHNEKIDGSIFVCRVHFYLWKKWEGFPKETEEMINPTPFNINDLPLKGMMPADREFIPLILKNEKLLVEAHYTPFQKKLKGKVKIKRVKFLPED